jgi:sec-independent protein translocase protein TatB
MSFGELCILVIVAVVVIGPKDLPRVLRKAGQFAGKLRRMANDVRTESGIDEMLRSEGLHKEIAEIRRLAQGDFNSPISRPDKPALDLAKPGLVVVRDREYPREGADSHSAIPDTANMYAQGLPKSRFARDPLYVTGDASAVLPPLEPANPAPEPDPGPEPGANEHTALAAPPAEVMPATPPSGGHG